MEAMTGSSPINIQPELDRMLYVEFSKDAFATTNREDVELRAGMRAMNRI